MQYVGIQTQQSRNNLRSAFLLFLFPCLVAALLYLACYLLTFMGYKEDMEVEMMPIVNHFFFSSLPYTMGIVLIWFLIAYWANTSIINSATGSKPQFLGSLCIPAVLTTKTSPFPISAR